MKRGRTGGRRPRKSRVPSQPCSRSRSRWAGRLAGAASAPTGRRRSGHSEGVGSIADDGPRGAGPAPQQPDGGWHRDVRRACSRSTPSSPRRQHEAYVDALRAAGGRSTRWRRPTTSRLGFVEDTVVVCGDLAVLARPGAPRARAPRWRAPRRRCARSASGRADRGPRHARRRRRPDRREDPLRGPRRPHQRGGHPPARGAGRRAASRSSPSPLRDVLHLKSRSPRCPTARSSRRPPLLDTSPLPPLRPCRRRPARTSSCSAATPC